MGADLGVEGVEVAIFGGRRAESARRSKDATVCRFELGKCLRGNNSVEVRAGEICQI